MATSFHSLDEALKRRFGEKVYKISLDAGCTCPNRDGTKGFGGCIFCADSAYAKSTESIELQLKAAKEKVSSKIKTEKYIAYFQSGTNTYGEKERLRSIFEAALSDPEVVALSIGTRPDCLSEEILEMLSNLRSAYGKPIWIELGLQTANENTAGLINRGYPLSVFEEAYKRLKDYNFEVIVHVIIGLPGEGEKEIFETVEYLSGLTPVLDGIKLQLLHVLKGTELYEMYKENPEIIHEYELNEYVELVRRLIAVLPEETVVHRITGDGPRSLLVTPLWTTDKKRVLNTFQKALLDIPQGI